VSCPEETEDAMTHRQTPPHLAEPTLTYVADGARDEFIEAVLHGFHEDYSPELWELHKQALEPDRTFGYQVDGRWVATCSAYSRTMSVPGGSVPTAAVTVVTVSPTFRRRGLLTAMMKHQLDDIQRGKEPLALLWASESAIYGRFGYGQATSRLRISGRTRSTTYRPSVDLGQGSTGEVDRDEWLAAVRPLHQRLLAQRPGALDRDDSRWAITLYDPQPWRDGAAGMRYLLHYAKAGRVDGYARFRVKSGGHDGGSGAEVQVSEIDAIDPRAYAGLWRFLLDLDLVRSFARHDTPVDEPLRYLLLNPGTIKTELSDGTYLRLVDVRTALKARTYAVELDVVLGVQDALLPHNNAALRLQAGPDGASVGASRRRPDLSLDVRDLAAIYLGGTPLTALHTAGLVQQRTTGSVAAVTAAFSTPRPPFCPDNF
jgi:predicted acetyltransferase